MTELVVTIVRLGIGLLGLMAPLALGYACLRARDRRASALWAAALKELNAPELRGLYALKVRARPFGADSVAVDLRGCSRELALDTLERMAARLPAGVRLAVNGAGGMRAEHSWTLTCDPRAEAACCGA
jgi:hypothetical protein